MKKTKTFSESEIRPKDLEAGQKIAIQNDINNLLSKKGDFVEVDCPACGEKNKNEKFNKNGFSYTDCKNCNTFYLNPRPTEKIIEEFLEHSENYKYWSKYIFPTSAEVRRKKIFIPRVERILELCQKYGVRQDFLLEVGAGYGIFCEELNKKKVFKKVVGVEPSPTLAEICRDKGVETIETTIEKAAGGIKERFNVVVNFEVIEHLFSPREFIIACKKLLKPGGLFIVTCPNSEGFDVVTLGVGSDTVDHEHLNYFNPDSLATLLQKCGFEVIEKMTPGKLDADIVRNKILDGSYDITNQPFLKKVLVDEWENLGEPFQKFLSDNNLSSNMWLVAKAK